VPFTGAPLGPVTRNVDEVIEAGSIALLNVAEIICVRGTATAPFAGTVEITTGSCAGVCSRPQAVVRPARISARAHIVRTENLRITCSYSRGAEAPPNIEALGRSRLRRACGVEAIVCSDKNRGGRPLPTPAPTQ